MSPLAIKSASQSNLLRGLFGLLLLVMAIGYFSFQARVLLKGPVVVIADTAIVQTEPAIDIIGQVQNIVSLTLNGRPIYTDPDGNFKTTLILENGYTIMTLRAAGRYGRERVIRHPFIYQPAETITKL